MRLFYLENSAGERIGLNGENGYFLDSPTGLGLTNSLSWANYGNAFFSKTYQEIKQGSIVGNIIFKRPNAYQKYQTFMAWIARAGVLTMVYNPSGTEYRRAVNLSQIAKSELTNFGGLNCAVTFTAATPWYRTRTFTGTTISGLIAAGDLPSAFEITTTFTGTDPAITLTDSGGTEIGACAVTGTYSSAGVEFSTRPDDSHLLIGGEDMVSYVDITRDLYFRLPLETTATLATTGGAALNVTVFDYWGTI